jgi:hypothetical protein
VDPISFRNVIVTPTAAILHRPLPVEFQGGPAWPDFESQRAARHLRGKEAKPFDTAPDVPAAPPAESLAEALWCGPLCPHFGHAIADYGGRIAVSAHLRPGLPLLFSHRGEEEAPPFFAGLLRQLGVEASRAVILRRPVRVGLLHVFPQAERLQGPAPDPAYLDLLQRHGAGDTDPELAGRTVFLSRSKVRADTLIGRIAGEAYLDEALRRAGVIVAYPEELPLAEQMRLYRSAGRLLFSEGSALHGLQLLGRIRAEVGVLVRRPGSRMAGNAVRPRAARLHWLEAMAGLVRGRRRDGVGFDVSRGLAVPDAAALQEVLGARFGIHLAPHWDAGEFRAAVLADLQRWRGARRALTARRGYPADDAAVVAQCLAELGLAAPA